MIENITTIRRSFRPTMDTYRGVTTDGGAAALTREEFIVRYNATRACKMTPSFSLRDYAGTLVNVTTYTFTNRVTGDVVDVLHEGEVLDGVTVEDFRRRETAWNGAVRGVMNHYMV